MTTTTIIIALLLVAVFLAGAAVRHYGDTLLDGLTGDADDEEDELP